MYAFLESGDGWMLGFLAVVLAAFHVVALVFATVMYNKAMFLEASFPIAVFFGAISTLVVNGGYSDRQQLVLLLVAIWAVRLLAHLQVRVARASRRHYAGVLKRPARFLAWQAVHCWILCAPLAYINSDRDEFFQIELDMAGLAVWVTGAFIGALADGHKQWVWTAVHSSAKEPTAERLLTSGLWSLSRHPNYFGESLVWSAFALMAVAQALVAGESWPAIAALCVPAIYVTSQLLFFAGIVGGPASVAERALGGYEQPGGDIKYKQYAASTASLFIAPPGWAMARAMAQPWARHRTRVGWCALQYFACMPGSDA